ncbi:hypothetical protein GCM10020254_87040 [Streptomyces goshikiensis]
MFFIDTIETEGLGNRSYLAGGAHTAVVVDPPRDIDRVLAAAAARGYGYRTWWRPTSTTTTSPAAWTWPA